MWLKLLIVVTCLYVVGASVAPSILDDEDASNLREVSRTARSCGFASCNSFCRKLGHARGVCIGTYCQCRFRRRRSLDEEAVADNAAESYEKPVLSHKQTFEGNVNIEPETFVAVSGDDSSEKVTVRSCGYAECNSFCRKLGYARGVCIGTYCQCRYRLASLPPSADLTQEGAVDDGEIGEKPRVSSDENEDASEHERVARDARPCSTSGCSAHCRRLGHARGVCIGSYCQCRSRLARSTDLEDGSNAEKSDNDDEKPSDEETFVGIIIIKSKTSIDDNAEADELYGIKENIIEDNLITPINEEESVLEARSGDCNLRWCEQNCRRIGFPGGACVNGRCKCDILRSATSVPAPLSKFENSIEDNLITPINDEESVLEARSEDCNLRWCEQNCRRIGFPGGACVNGRCKCDILRSATSVPAPFSKFENSIEEESVLETRSEDCNLRWCEQNCRRIGFPGGACVNGRCKCDILRSATSVPAPFLKLDDEEDSSARAVRTCTDATCRQTCRRLGFPLGRCSRNGHCFCWRYRL